jgi:DNA repair protein RecO (recombination protein O)
MVPKCVVAARGCRNHAHFNMHTIDTDAIILATSDHGESDRLITFLTRSNGKLKGIAKGARRSHKRFVHSFEPLSLVALQIRERSTASLMWVEACKLVEPHIALRDTLDRWGFAALLAEVMVELVPERVPQEELFLLMKGGLTHLEVDRDATNVAILGLFRMLAALGYILELGSCSQCQQPLNKMGHFWLHLTRGQLLCERHETRVRGGIHLDLGTLALLLRARTADPDQLWRLRLRSGVQTPLLEALLEVVGTQMNKELKSSRFLRDIGAL